MGTRHKVHRFEYFAKEYASDVYAQAASTFYVQVKGQCCSVVNMMHLDAETGCFSYLRLRRASAPQLNYHPFGLFLRMRLHHCSFDFTFFRLLTAHTYILDINLPCALCMYPKKKILYANTCQRSSNNKPSTILKKRNNNDQLAAIAREVYSLRIYRTSTVEHDFSLYMPESSCSRTIQQKRKGRKRAVACSRVAKQQQQWSPTTTTMTTTETTTTW
ncbi:unnamed protein product [Trichogramma brassicae]|uniref:Uncharacterized protein n=1 Tax=Trichogramma brassicae TaxID=86971 RepID=A0A6H5I560_9HYME|nr:unnamed protein product [Trichogramma brassicae]